MTTTNNAVLVDTDVFSYLLNSEDKRAEVYKKHVHNKTVAISIVTASLWFQTIDATLKDYLEWISDLRLPP